jgi:hypothetical protein
MPNSLYRTEMADKTSQEDSFNWRLLLYAALGMVGVCIPVAIWESDGLLYFVVVAPLVTLCLLALSLYSAVRKKPRRCVATLFMLLVYLSLSFALHNNCRAIRNTARWSLWADDYKAQVLKQPDSANEEFKHIEWDGWGFPGAGDTTVYLVFDPADSLLPAAIRKQAGQYRGLPCEVFQVHRLERQWYTVQFYTDEWWRRKNALNCIGL